MIIRPARIEEAAGIARVQTDSWRSTYKGIVPDDYLASMSYEERTQGWRTGLSSPTRIAYDFVAEDDTGQIIGFISGGPVREHDPVYKGELYAIYLLQ